MFTEGGLCRCDWNSNPSPSLSIFVHTTLHSHPAGRAESSSEESHRTFHLDEFCRSLVICLNPYIYHSHSDGAERRISYRRSHVLFSAHKELCEKWTQTNRRSSRERRVKHSSAARPTARLTQEVSCSILNERRNFTLSSGNKFKSASRKMSASLNVLPRITICVLFNR